MVLVYYYIEFGFGSKLQLSRYLFESYFAQTNVIYKLNSAFNNISVCVYMYYYVNMQYLFICKVYLPYGWICYHSKPYNTMGGIPHG